MTEKILASGWALKMKKAIAQMHNAPKDEYFTPLSAHFKLMEG